jgi:hypothetical protein
VTFSTTRVIKVIVSGIRVTSVIKRVRVFRVACFIEVIIRAIYVIRVRIIRGLTSSADERERFSHHSRGAFRYGHHAAHDCISYLGHCGRLLVVTRIITVGQLGLLGSCT